MLEKFFVKDADLARNYRLTFDEDGFYRVLKSRVAEKLPTLDKSDLWKSKLYLDIIVLGLFIASILSVRFESAWLKITLVVIAGQFAAILNAASHNFTHQRNNWRMYTANFVLTGWRDWRVFHGLVRTNIKNIYNACLTRVHEIFQEIVIVEIITFNFIVVKLLILII